MKFSVLVAGSANVTGMNVIKDLVWCTHSVVGYDCCPSSQNPANTYCINEEVPKAEDKGYIEAVLALAKRNNTNFIIASNDHDVRALAVHQDELKKRGITVNAVDKSTLTYLDKRATSNLFTAHGIKTPEILGAYDWTVPPYVVRKRFVGEGKKFTLFIKNKVDLENLFFFPESSIVTRFEEGPEYTIDILAHQGRAIAIVPRLRHEVRNGMVHFAEVVQDHEVIEASSRIIKALNFDGMYCIQCIKNEAGCHFFEVNPRPGSGLSLTSEAGINMPLLWLTTQNGNYIDRVDPKWGLKMIRYQTGYYFR